MSDHVPSPAVRDGRPVTPPPPCKGARTTFPHPPSFQVGANVQFGRF
jgi:hypothetical protein